MNTEINTELNFDDIAEDILNQLDAPTPEKVAEDYGITVDELLGGLADISEPLRYCDACFNWRYRGDSFDSDGNRCSEPMCRD